MGIEEGHFCLCNFHGKELENKKDTFGFAVILSGNCQAHPYIWSSGFRRTLRYKYGPPDNYQTTSDSKTKLLYFIPFLMHSDGKFREDIGPNI